MELLKILEYPKNFLLYFMMDFDVLITMELFSLNKLISLGRKEKFFMGVGTLKIFYCLILFDLLLEKNPLALITIQLLKTPSKNYFSFEK